MRLDSYLSRARAIASTLDTQKETPPASLGRLSFLVDIVGVIACTSIAVWMRYESAQILLGGVGTALFLCIGLGCIVAGAGARYRLGRQQFEAGRQEGYRAGRLAGVFEEAAALRRQQRLIDEQGHNAE